MEQFGTLACKLGFVSAKQLRECLQIQQQSSDNDLPHRYLGQIMLAENYLSEAQIVAVLKAQNLKQATCSRCQKVSNVSIDSESDSCLSCAEAISEDFELEEIEEIEELDEDSPEAKEDSSTEDWGNFGDNPLLFSNNRAEQSSEGVDLSLYEQVPAVPAIAKESLPVETGKRAPKKMQETGKRVPETIQDAIPMEYAENVTNAPEVPQAVPIEERFMDENTSETIVAWTEEEAGEEVPQAVPIEIEGVTIESPQEKVSPDEIGKTWPGQDADIAEALPLDAQVLSPGEQNKMPDLSNIGSDDDLARIEQELRTPEEGKDGAPGFPADAQEFSDRDVDIFSALERDNAKPAEPADLPKPELEIEFDELMGNTENFLTNLPQMSDAQRNITDNLNTELDEASDFTAPVADELSDFSAQDLEDLGTPVNMDQSTSMPDDLSDFSAEDLGDLGMPIDLEENVAGPQNLLQKGGLGEPVIGEQAGQAPVFFAQDASDQGKPANFKESAPADVTEMFAEFSPKDTPPLSADRPLEDTVERFFSSPKEDTMEFSGKEGSQRLDSFGGVAPIGEAIDLEGEGEGEVFPIEQIDLGQGEAPGGTPNMQTQKWNVDSGDPAGMPNSFDIESDFFSASPGQNTTKAPSNFDVDFPGMAFGDAASGNQVEDFFPNENPPANVGKGTGANAPTLLDANDTGNAGTAMPFPGELSGFSNLPGEEIGDLQAPLPGPMEMNIPPMSEIDGASDDLLNVPSFAPQAAKQKSKIPDIPRSSRHLKDRMGSRRDRKRKPASKNNTTVLLVLAVLMVILVILAVVALIKLSGKPEKKNKRRSGYSSLEEPMGPPPQQAPKTPKEIYEEALYQDYNRGQYVQALKKFEQALDYEDAKLCAAECCLKGDLVNTDKAARYAKESIAKKESSRGYNILGQCEENRENLQGALDNYQKSLEFNDTGSHSAMQKIIRIYQKQEKYLEALEFIKIRGAPSDAIAVRQALLQDLQVRSPREQVDILRKAIDYDPTYVGYHYNLARLLWEKQPRQAIDYLKQFLENAGETGLTKQVPMAKNLYFGCLYQDYLKNGEKQNLELMKQMAMANMQSKEAKVMFPYAELLALAVVSYQRYLKQKPKGKGKGKGKKKAKAYYNKAAYRFYVFDKATAKEPISDLLDQQPWLKKMKRDLQPKLKKKLKRIKEKFVLGYVDVKLVVVEVQPGNVLKRGDIITHINNQAVYSVYQVWAGRENFQNLVILRNRKSKTLSLGEIDEDMIGPKAFLWEHNVEIKK